MPPQGEEGVHLDEERTIVVRLHLRERFQDPSHRIFA